MCAQRQKVGMVEEKAAVVAEGCKHVMKDIFQMSTKLVYQQLISAMKSQLRQLGLSYMLSVWRLNWRKKCAFVKLHGASSWLQFFSVPKYNFYFPSLENHIPQMHIVDSEMRLYLWQIYGRVCTQKWRINTWRWETWNILLINFSPKTFFETRVEMRFSR